MKSRRLVPLAAAATALLIGLVGCASTTAASPSATSAADHNEADTTFAQMMVIHHEGAVEMAGLASTEAGNADVRSLAARIQAAQGPEIDQMRAWLQQWGEPAPEDSDMGGMDHGGMDMGGLDQQAAMEELKTLDGEAFDQKFLSLMIQHHQGALIMAEQEVESGLNEAAIALANTIILAQQKEIAEMEGMLEQLG